LNLALRQSLKSATGEEIAVAKGMLEVKGAETALASVSIAGWVMVKILSKKGHFL
jgi:hypothetical protein